MSVTRKFLASLSENSSPEFSGNQWTVIRRHSNPSLGKKSDKVVRQGDSPSGAPVKFESEAEARACKEEQDAAYKMFNGGASYLSHIVVCPTKNPDWFNDEGDGVYTLAVR